MDSTPTKRKETNINGELSSRVFLPPSERWPSAPVPSIVDENWAGVDIMFYLDGGWRRQSLVYFEAPVSSANVAGGAFREARGYVPRCHEKYLVSAND